MNQLMLSGNPQRNLMLHETVLQVCQRIAPNWPLDKAIAVNPYWELKHQPFTKVAAKLSALGNMQSQMPLTFWQDLYNQRQISDSALQQACRQFNYDKGLSALATREAPQNAAKLRWHNLSMLVDNYRSRHQVSWHDEIIHQLSQFCAAFFQSSPVLEQVNSPQNSPCFYASWRKNITKDSGISILMGEPRLAQAIRSLPHDPETVFELASAELALSATATEHYLHALLLDVNGWAAYIAYRRWQGLDDNMSQLLAARLAWELIIWRHLAQSHPDLHANIQAHWQEEQARIADKIQRQEQQQLKSWIWQTAYELTQQQKLQQQLATAPVVTASAVKMQAIFCIDVRSEIIRRALEQQDAGIATYGFAGFFGMPIAFSPKGTTLHRPQLPGLLSPQISASLQSDKITRLRPIKNKANWQRWSHSPTGSFSMVESSGWWYGFKLLKNMWFPEKQENPVSSLSHDAKWQLSKNGQPLSGDECVELAKGVLTAMGLKSFAPEVLLVGHGSQCSNNLHAAALDCGACGGQSGEVNVRVLAQLLNDKAVREGLQTQGITIPQTTRFIAALHNTTTDDIQCFAEQLNEQQQRWLHEATALAQSERATSVDSELSFLSQKQRNKAYQKRSKDWSQVRPEWGLAGNHSFIIAPRSLTRSLNLAGKVFLHDYDWQQDNAFAVLELLLTAPMVVTHWINMQYNASVTDNQKFGCGNKVLHNAVAGNIGVFEGNGGDLRIGLSMQSVHNGKRWMHTPQRLSVYVDAPQQAIADIVQKHEHIQHLVDNQWLYLFCCQQRNNISRLYQGNWQRW